MTEPTEATCQDCGRPKARPFSYVEYGECPVGVAQPMHGCDMRQKISNCQSLTIARLRSEIAQLLARPCYSCGAHTREYLEGQGEGPHLPAGLQKPPVSMRDLDEISRYVGIAPQRVRALFGVLAMVSPPAKLDSSGSAGTGAGNHPEHASFDASFWKPAQPDEPLQPSTRELIEAVRDAIRLPENGANVYVVGRARLAIDELEKRIGGERG